MVENCPKIPWYLFWYPKLSNVVFGNSFQELEQEIIALKSEERIKSLLQGLEVSNQVLGTYIIYLTFSNQQL